MAEGSAEIRLSVLGSGAVQLQPLLQSSQYTQGIKISLLRSLPAAQVGRLRGDLQNGVTFASVTPLPSIKISHKICTGMIITL